ncbi:hypothetical protein PI124_g10443 [Phytophthora idaei]|nr:hypothetical protein PI126_g13868 [Phytophthora idaei]KAG3244794.1 hypothetical protein PI124_g10443 [Phytophthora idaei]
MSGAYWFAMMNLMSVYYQVRMREEDIKFTAFQAPNGLWEYLVLPMGVCNVPATMHRLTSKLFQVSENTKSRTIEDHLEALRKTLDLLRDNKLCVKLSKCVFCAEEIPHRGTRRCADGPRQGADDQGLTGTTNPRRASQLSRFNWLRSAILPGIRIIDSNHVRSSEEEGQAQREDQLRRRAVEEF